jgi:hypothetical protein
MILWPEVFIRIARMAFAAAPMVKAKQRMDAATGKVKPKRVFYRGEQ